MELLSAQREFSAYGPSHLVVLAVFAGGAALLVWIGRRQTESQARLLGRVLAALIVTAFGVALVYKLIHPALDTSVPLQLCDIAELTAAYALWSQRHWAFALTYYWGLVLSSQALITPDIGTPEEGAPDFPHHLFVTFFTLHVLVVWSAIYSRGGVGCGRGGVTTASRSSRPSHGRHSPSSSMRSRDQLRLSQQETPNSVTAGRVGPVAGLSAGRGHDRPRRVGPDDLAVGGTETAHESSSVA